MPALPLPLIVSLILGFLLLQSLLRGEGSRLVMALIGACALQGAVISANQYYGLQGFAAVQPVTAALIPPLAWVAFQSVAVRGFDLWRDIWHGWAPLFTWFCTGFAPDVLDQVILAVFMGYGAAMLIALRKGRDSLVLTRLDSGEVPLHIWRVIAVALLVSGVSDLLIVAAQMMGQAQLQPIIIAVFTSVWLLVLGGLGLSRSLDGAAPEPENDAEIAATKFDAELDAGLIERLRDLLAERPLYLDPSLSLGQLARRLQVPAKALSGAINRSQGENVSRFINRFRVAHACDLLAKGESVTEAMLASGFNTKSNFNREFLRLQGCAPTEWLAKQPPPDQDVVDKVVSAP